MIAPANRLPLPPRPFDLTRLDSAADALVMPLIDTVAALRQHPDSPVSVEVTSGDQVLTYGLDSSRNSLSGAMNGQPFDVPEIEGLLGGSFKGTTPGGGFELHMQMQKNGFHASAQIGTVPLDETFTRSDTGAEVTGHVAGNDYHVVWTHDPGSAWTIGDGTLGPDRFHQSMEERPDGTAVVETSIGTTHIHELLKPLE